MKNSFARNSLIAMVVAGALFAVGCSSKDEAASTRDIAAESRAFYESYKYVPPELKDQLQSGKVTQETYDAAMAAAPLFFQQKTLADLPAGLTWDNGLQHHEFGSDKAKKGGTLHTWLQDFPRTLRIVGPDANSHFRPYIGEAVRPGLAYPHPDITERGPNSYAYIPFLAREWAIDWDSQYVYVKLDPEARWSDGEKVTTDDFKFMFFYMTSTYIVAPYSNNFFSEKYTSFISYDEHTFAMRVADKKPDMEAYALALDPVPEHFFKELGDDFVERYNWKFVPTTGPYLIRDEDINKGRSITITRDTNWWARDRKYWRQLYNFDKIHFSIIRDEANATLAFLKGDLDVNGQGSRRPDLWDDKFGQSQPPIANGYIEKVSFYNDIPRPNFGIWINTSKPLLNNKDVRVGLHYATNWDLILEKYFRGAYVRLQALDQGYGEYIPTDLKARKFDVEKALEAFARAGFTKRGADGILANEQGQRLTFNLSTGYTYFADLVSILKEEAQKAGVELRLEILDSTTGWKKVQEKTHELHFVAFRVTGRYPSYWQNLHSDNAYDRSFLEDGSPNPERKVKVQTNNLMVYANAEMDRLINAYDRSNDREEMVELSHKILHLAHDDAIFIPGFAQPFYRLAKWRWVQFPETQDYKTGDINSYGLPDGPFVGWIDEDIRKETLEAMKSGKTFPPVDRIYDKYRVDH